MQKNNSSCLTLIIILYPLLNVYGALVNNLGAGDLLLALCIPVMVVKMFKNKISFNISFVWGFVFFIYSVMITVFNIGVFGYSLRDGMVRLLVETFHLVLIVCIVLSNSFNLRIALRYYKTISIIVSVGIIIQAVTHYLFSFNVYLLIPGLRYNQSTLSNYETYTTFYNMLYSYAFRPTSLFLEPSHVALFLCPYLAIAFSSVNLKKNEWMVLVLVSIAVILTTAGTGYLFLAIIWLIIVKKVVISNNINTKVLLFILIGITVLLCFVISSSYFSILVARLGDIGSGSESSINVRLLKGFKFWSTLSPFEKLFGIGCGTYNSYILSHPSGAISYEYMNSISYILCSTGLIGLSLFTIFIYVLMKKSFVKNKVQIVVLIIAVYLSGSVLFSAFDLIYYVVLLSKRNYGTNENQSVVCCMEEFNSEGVFI